VGVRREGEEIAALGSPKTDWSERVTKKGICRKTYYSLKQGEEGGEVTRPVWNEGSYCTKCRNGLTPKLHQKKRKSASQEILYQGGWTNPQEEGGELHIETAIISYPVHKNCSPAKDIDPQEKIAKNLQIARNRRRELSLRERGGLSSNLPARPKLSMGESRC